MFLQRIKQIKPAESLDVLPPPQVYGRPQFLIGSVLERVDDVDVDVEADQEGDAELEDNRADAKTDPGESSPFLPADFTTLEDGKLHV